MHDKEYDCRRKSPTDALFEACLSRDFYGFIEALDNGANPRGMDDDGNIIGEMLLWRTPSEDVDEFERAGMWEALLDAGFVPHKDELDWIQHHIERHSLDQCALAFLNAMDRLPALSGLREHLLDETHWWAGVQANKDAESLHKETPSKSVRPNPKSRI